MLNGILWVLGTGAPWRELTRKYPPYRTCRRRLQQWVRERKLERIVRVLAKELQTQGKLRLEEAFIDASFTGQKRGPRDRAYQGGGTKIIALAMIAVFLSPSVLKSPPHETQLVEAVLGHSFLDLDILPARLIDKAHDSDPFLAERYGIEMIALHRGVRRNPTQDGRPLHRYRKRWRVERLFAWLHHFRRLVIRWEYPVENFFGMVRLGCMQILFRNL